MYQKVGINSNDGTGRSYLCQFRSQSQMDKFINQYENYPGYCIMTFDHWDENKNSFHLPTVGANVEGFLRVINNWK